MRGLIIDCFAGGGGASVGIDPLEDEDRTRADSDELAGASVKECGGAVPA